ncbi:MAG: arginine deiminase family protein [Thermoplasmataceae archaeon]
MRIKAEWDRLNDVMIHRPGIEIAYAMLAPRPFLFERPFRISRAAKEHELLEQTMKEAGVNVRVLRDMVVDEAEKSSDFRKALEQKVISTVRFFGTVDSANRASGEFRKNIEIIDSSTLLQILTLEPSIDLKRDAEDMQVEYPTVYSNIPLANLYFMRDQQAVGNNGVVVGNMKKGQRSRETEITEFVIRHILHEKEVFRVSDNGIFEGGDFIPAGNFALIGTGPRTDMNGAMEVINSGKFDYDEILVVDNPVYDFMEENTRDSMINMHLDTYFNIAGDGIAVTSLDLAKKAKGIVMEKESRGVYRNARSISLFDYLREKNFSFINLRLSEQMGYSSNFLTLSNRKILTVNVKDVIQKLMSRKVFSDTLYSKVRSDLEKSGPDKLFPDRKEISDYGIDNITLELSELTGGYGGAHCMTAALNRT